MTDYLALSPEEFGKLPDYPTHYWALLNLWLTEKDKLDRAKANELTYRTLLAAVTFSDPVEGTNNHLFGVGKKAAKLTMTYPINRNIDDAAIGPCLDMLRETIGAAADDVVKFKPTLAVGPFKKLTMEQQAILAPAITAAPGTPQLKYTPEKV